ncbi:hypothetical protein BYT27DRAFT_7168044 [Phlegmacium glaucopus]|nr:hypothetical protein BYT27DRAFT_7168044 [Phlegmacium glaucopus]
MAISRSERQNVTMQEIEDGKQWVHEMYRMADAKNVGMVGIFLNEDAILNFSNAPPLQGRSALERLYIWEYGACPRIDHRWVRVLEDQIIVKLAITYHFKSGSHHAMNCVFIWHKLPQDKRASRVDVDGNFSQVFQELVAVAGPPPFSPN